MSNPAEQTLVQPDYATKPVTRLMSAVIKAVSFVRKGANAERWLLYKSADELGEPTLSFPTPLIKRHVPEDKKGVWREAFIRIAIPGVEDLQKDIWTEEEISKAFESFVEHGNVLNWDHGSMESRGRVNQNAIALSDFDLETADGKVETITKGTWYMSVIPDDQMRRDIESGLVTGMSVQGSAERIPMDAEHGSSGSVQKADKMDRPVALGTTGEGVKRIQNILGVEETGKYNEETETALVEWMKGRGVPGIPTIATVKMCLTESATPVAAPAPAAAPVEGGTVVTEKHDEPYNPAAGDNVPPRPVGTPGINTAQVTAESSTDDLKALIAQSIREGNDGLERYMADQHGGASVGDLYGRDISHADLWFLISKFIHGSAPSINAQGEYENRGPEVEKGAWTGSMGGHDPDAHKGGIQNIIRAYPKWTGGSMKVGVAKLLKHGVVKTEKAGWRLLSWIRDQYEGTTSWRNGNEENLHKSGEDGLRALLEESGEDSQEVASKLASPDVLAAMSRDESSTEVEKSPEGDVVDRVKAALQSGLPADELVAQIRAAITGPQEAEKSEDPALAALTAALKVAVQDEDLASRTAAVDQIVREFSQYSAHKGEKDSVADASESVPAVPVGRDITFLNKGEDMTGPLIDEATAASLATAVDFLTGHLSGAAEEIPAEVEKDDVPPALKGKMAPPFQSKDGGPKGAANAEPASPDAEGDLEEQLNDEGEDVSEDELLQVMSHLVDEVDAVSAAQKDMSERISALESGAGNIEKLDDKLDTVGELAKAIAVSDEVTEKVEKFAAVLNDLSKSIATQSDIKTVQSRVEEVAKRLDAIAKTPNRSGVIPVDTKVTPAPQAMAKADLSENPWADSTNNPFR